MIAFTLTMLLYHLACASQSNHYLSAFERTAFNYKHANFKELLVILANDNYLVNAIRSAENVDQLWHLLRTA